jgi:hypothetical protein
MFLVVNTRDETTGVQSLHSQRGEAHRFPPSLFLKTSPRPSTTTRQTVNFEVISAALLRTIAAIPANCHKELPDKLEYGAADVLPCGSPPGGSQMAGSRTRAPSMDYNSPASFLGDEEIASRKAVVCGRVGDWIESGFGRMGRRWKHRAPGLEKRASLVGEPGWRSIANENRRGRECHLATPDPRFKDYTAACLRRPLYAPPRSQEREGAGRWLRHRTGITMGKRRKRRTPGFGAGLQVGVQPILRRSKTLPTML